jgi:hypothetical protein
MPSFTKINGIFVLAEITSQFDQTSFWKCSHLKEKVSIFVLKMDIWTFYDWKRPATVALYTSAFIALWMYGQHNY